jgi:hypothetical protein
MDDIASEAYMPVANLSLTSQKLYNCISGKKFSLSTPDFPATLEEPSETERAAVLEKIAKPDLSGDGGGGDDLLKIIVRTKSMLLRRLK